MQPPRTTPRALPIQRSGRGRGWKVASGLGLALVVLGFLTLPRYCDRRARVRYEGLLQQRTQDLAHWKGWLETGTCLRRDERALGAARSAEQPADAANPSGSAAAPDPASGRECLASLGPLEDDPGLPSEARTAVHAWIASDRALERAAAGSTDELGKRSAERRRVLAQVRGQLLPAVRDQIRTIQDRHAKSHNYVWWRVELGLLLEEVLDRGTQAHRAGKDVVAAIREPLDRLLARTREGHDTAIREMPAVDALARATGEAAWTTLLQVEDNGAWNELEHDGAVFGTLPAGPEGCSLGLE
ncbi:MAG TPA: hypothetical protein VFK02_35370 [Kofleriaceae bacterium]|nr:hypothetical protein [Kofleriaceae bacterium]